MSGLKNTVKRLVNVSIGKGYKTGRERRADKEAKRQARVDKIYDTAEIPDEEAIKRNERRKAAKRQGSRAQTVLTDDDRLG